MERLEKNLNSLSENQKIKIKEILLKIKSGNLNNLDLKKLKEREDVFRVRKGKIRVIFYYKKDEIYILSIEKRNDNTYST